jgi:hypothetical protein
MAMQDPDIDRRSKTLLGRLRRWFDRDRGSDWHWYDWWEDQARTNRDGSPWHGWGE